MSRRLTLVLYLLVIVFSVSRGKKPKETPEWAKKDITDFSDADMERLLDQWEEDEEPLEPDELPEHLRERPKIDLSNFQGKDPEEILKFTKKGQTLMSFVVVDGEPDRDRTEMVTKLWQTSLWNNHIQAERYVIEDNRAIFMFKDGSQAWDAKNFLIEQPECKEVLIENKSYPGIHTKVNNNEKEEL